MFSPNYYYSQSKTFQNKPFSYKLTTFRKNTNNKISNTKSPILIFGCSFAYGWLLEDKEVFSNRLSELTNRNTYNMSLPACGIQHMFHLLKDETFHKFIYQNSSNTPEYAIFVYIPSHLQRISSVTYPFLTTNTGNNLIYELKKNELTEKQYLPFIHKFYLVKKLNMLIEKQNPPDSIEMKYKNFTVANELFIASKKILESHYPNIKFVILKYSSENDYSEYEVPFMWDILKKEGFIVIDSKDLIGRLYTDKDKVKDDNFHPNAQAWEELIPPLIKELEL